MLAAMRETSRQESSNDLPKAIRSTFCSASTGRALLVRMGAAFIFLMALGEVASGRNPITVVVLPPPPLTASQDTVAAIELFCDQLAAELANDAELRVVDRTQIDRLLGERALVGGAPAVLAYDVLLRVGIDVMRAKPVVILRIVDLSTGNMAGCHEWPWTSEFTAGHLGEMAKKCKESAFGAVSASRGRVKVRVLGVDTPRGMDRLQPMREHFEQMIGRVVAACPKVCVVQHLEAMTAKEESLLLLLGQARLASQRPVLPPHADRVLAAEIAETDAQGKTFGDTTLEIRFRLSNNGQDGDWTRVSGKVADWANLAPQACRLLAEQLGQARPEATVQYVLRNDRPVAVRPRQN